MKYLFYSTCNATPHLQTELEIASDLIEQGHEVFFWVCKGQFNTCFINIKHNKIQCLACQSMGAAGLKLIGIDRSHIIDFPNIVIDESVIPLSFKDIDQLKAFSYKGADVGLAVASSMVSSTRDHAFDTIKYKREINEGLRTAIFVYESAKKKLEEIKPDNVIIFNGRFLESRPLLRACEQMGITFYTHERGGNITNYIMRENTTPHSIRATIKDIEDVWRLGDEKKHDIGRKFFEERRNKVIQSWTVFTEGQVHGQLPANFDKSKKNIAIFNSSMDEYEGIPDFKNKIYKNDNDGIRQLCESFETDPHIQFYLRVHPNLKGLNNTQVNELNTFKNRFSNLIVIDAEEEIDTYALMEAVDYVVTYGSTIGIEAIYWNKPSILLGRSFYEELEGVLVPKTHQEVCELINSALKPPAANLDSLKYGYWSLMQGFEFKKFKPQGLFNGKFNGKTIKASKKVRLMFHSQKMFKKLFK